MGIVRSCLFIFSWVSVASICCAMNIQKGKSSSKIMLHPSLIRQLNEEDAQQWIGKSILYKVNDAYYKKVLLGNKIAGSDSYQVYFVQPNGTYNSGICATLDKLYIRNREEC